MIATCPKCGSYEWNKAVEDATTAGEIQKLTTDYVVLDADFFYNIVRTYNCRFFSNNEKSFYSAVAYTRMHFLFYELWKRKHGF